MKGSKVAVAACAGQSPGAGGPPAAWGGAKANARGGLPLVLSVDGGQRPNRSGAPPARAWGSAGWAEIGDIHRKADDVVRSKTRQRGFAAARHRSSSRPAGDATERPGAGRRQRQRERAMCGAMIGVSLGWRSSRGDKRRVFTGSTGFVRHVAAARPHAPRWKSHVSTTSGRVAPQSFSLVVHRRECGVAVRYAHGRVCFTFISCQNLRKSRSSDDFRRETNLASDLQ